jgi:Methyltransferase domain
VRGERLRKAANVLVSVEDAQALSFPDGSFDAVLCNLGLMFFPDPVRSLSEFRRGGRAAVSVNTVPERSYNHQINVILARYVPSLAEAVTRTFALGEASRLQALCGEAGFADIETDTVKHTFVLPSSDAYYGPFERGGASTGQALAAVSEETAAPCARRYDATSPTPADQSRWRLNTGSRMGGARAATRNRPPRPACQVIGLIRGPRRGRSSGPIIPQSARATRLLSISAVSASANGRYSAGPIRG